MGDERVKNEAMEIMGLFELLPRLVVFDLDYTLWPFYCECRSKRDTPRMYPHAKGILYALKDKGVKIAIASRSPTPDIANTFIDKLGIKSMFVALEIFSSYTHKTDHFQRIKRRTNIPYTEMLFFDDEDRNINAYGRYKYLGWQRRQLWCLERGAVKVLAKPVGFRKEQARLTKSVEKLKLIRSRGAVKFSLLFGNIHED